MADLGAEVIKVEPPDGDRSRRYGPFPGDAPDPEASGLFLYSNAGKLGVTLDVTSPAGARLFKALAREADALIENAEPGFMEAAGLDYRALRAENPRLVVTSLRPFGLTGRYKDLRGHDLTAWHASGAGHGFLGDPDQVPLRGAWHFASHFAAHNAAAATLFALHARERTGRPDRPGCGQLIDLSEAETMAVLVTAEPRLSVFMATGEMLRRDGKFHQGGAPSSLFPCKDGFVFIHAYEGRMWDGLMKVMGNPEWGSLPMFAGTYQERAVYQQELYDLMAAWLLQHNKQEIFEALQASYTPAAPLHHMGELLVQPHLRHRRYFRSERHPVAGLVEMPGAPYRLSRTPWRVRRRAPFLGEHNEQVYRGRLGLSGGDLVDLGRAGVI